jgi:hypothetical protein
MNRGQLQEALSVIFKVAVTDNYRVKKVKGT